MSSKKKVWTFGSANQKWEEDKAINWRTTKIRVQAFDQPPEVCIFEENDTLPAIISVHLDAIDKKELLNILKRHKKAIGWTLAKIQGISPSYYMHKIKLEEGQTSTIQF